MPIRSSRALRALLLAAIAAALFTAPAQAADDVVAELRVLAPEAVLEAGTSHVTNTERIKTDPQALCFAGGVGGSGDRVRLPGPTAMGLLETAGDSNADVDPLSVTDEFGFGLGLCGIGGVGGDESNYWSLTVNHQAAQVGGDQFQLEDGDTVLWGLTEFPPDPELELRAAPGTTPGTLDVSVVAWTCATAFPPPDPVCSEAPAEGASVSGGDSAAATNASGVASVPLAAAGSYTLQAQLAGHLASNLAQVCVSADPGACPGPTDPVGKTIRGRVVDDEFSGTGGWDVIRARAGRDRIDLTDGGSDRVNCGGGKDRVLVAPGDSDDEIAANCEKVKTLVP